MYKVFFSGLSVLFIVMLLGCEPLPEQVPGVESGTTTLNVNGIIRSLNYSVPEEGAEALIIALHGATDTPARFEDYSKITDIVNETKGFGVVYPAGINENWNDGRPELVTKTGDADDVGFINEIITHYKVEGYSKFYIVGMSNGGVMAQRMVCESAANISGIAVVSATQTTEISTNCSDNITAIDALFIFGSEDTIFSIDGTIAYNGGTHITMPLTRNYWVTRNECSSTILIKSLNKISDDHTVVDFNDGENCRAKFRYIDINGGGHRWADPSATNGSLLLGYASHEISTAEEIVMFFGL